MGGVDSDIWEVNGLEDSIGGRGDEGSGMTLRFLAWTMTWVEED